MRNIYIYIIAPSRMESHVLIHFLFSVKYYLVKANDNIPKKLRWERLKKVFPSLDVVYVIYLDVRRCWHKMMIEMRN